ncbi:hypothetical protein J437_LFUL007372 [Ladona fulva]|uniref:Neurotransmitter-gated ion-channel transmembrane domain-containing protein n=1 Tax=Ladona fulva TaxID=123851 RepID=A0A8K0NVX1_LADFU|nr:hypothetical protein J437_LFUL007372 [Ladona fulva]
MSSIISPRKRTLLKLKIKCTFSGNYSRLACEFQFRRSLGYYILQIYLPAAFVVVISWTTFWLNRNAPTTRMVLGIIALTVMGLLSSCINSDIPKVSYITALDLYLSFCFFMVFAALLEYITICYITKKIQNKKNRYLAIQKLADETNQGNETKAGVDSSTTGQKSTEVRFNVCDSKVATTDNGIENGKLEEEGKTSTIGIINKLCGISPSDLDKYSRILFPASFFCFNLMYWIIFLNITDTTLPNLITMEI